MKLDCEAQDPWLPAYISIASQQEVLDRVQQILHDDFIPSCFGDTDSFFPFDKWSEIEIGINQYALLSAIGNALKDIGRWSAFHLRKPSENKMARPDRHKYAGFLAKWISKERPIFLSARNSKSPVSIPPKLYQLNALFAVAVMQGYLHKTMPSKMVNELTYVLHFRDEKGETLAALAYAAEAMGT